MNEKFVDIQRDMAEVFGRINVLQARATVAGVDGTDIRPVLRETAECYKELGRLMDASIDAMEDSHE